MYSLQWERMGKEMIQEEKTIEEQLEAEDLSAAKGCFVGSCISLSVCLIISTLIYLVVMYVRK